MLAFKRTASQTPEDVTVKKTSKTVHQSPPTSLCVRILSMSGMYVLCSASVNHAACNQTPKKQRGAFLLSTSVCNATDLDRDDRNGSSHCRASPSARGDVRPPRSRVMQLHRLQLRRPPAAPATGISAALSRFISKTPAGSANCLQVAEGALSFKASCTTGCSSELVPLTNSCNCFVVLP